MYKHTKAFIDNRPLNRLFLIIFFIAIGLICGMVAFYLAVKSETLPSYDGRTYYLIARRIISPLDIGGQIEAFGKSLKSTHSGLFALLMLPIFQFTDLTLTSFIVVNAVIFFAPTLALVSLIASRLSSSKFLVAIVVLAYGLSRSSNWLILQEWYPDFSMVLFLSIFIFPDFYSC